MPGASGLYVDHGGQRYEIVPTQVTCYSAVTVLSHIRGEAFKRAYGREAPPDVVRTLEAKAAEEAAAAKATKQKKLAVLGARKGERELAEYKAHRAKLQERGVAGRCLYFASADSEGVLRFDCSACGRFVPAQAFRGHVTLAEHARALANAGLSEDYAFHAKQRDTFLDAERQSSPKGNWDDHCAGRAHRQAAAVAAVRSFVEKAASPASAVRQSAAGAAAASQRLQPLTKKARCKQNKRERESAEYDMLAAQRPCAALYRVVDISTGRRFDCGACRQFVEAHAFLFHVTSPAHAAAIAAYHPGEDEAFIEEHRKGAEEARAAAQGATYCHACGKWGTPQHFTSSAHLKRQPSR